MIGPAMGTASVRKAKIPSGSANGTPISVSPTYEPVPVTSMISSCPRTYAPSRCAALMTFSSATVSGG